jgi:hypothetical protein
MKLRFTIRWVKIYNCSGLWIPLAPYYVPDGIKGLASGRFWAAAELAWYIGVLENCRDNRNSMAAICNSGRAQTVLAARTGNFASPDAVTRNSIMVASLESSRPLRDT